MNHTTDSLTEVEVIGLRELLVVVVLTEVEVIGLRELLVVVVSSSRCRVGSDVF